MSQSFSPGDDLVFQLESGFGLLRVLAIEGDGPDTVWHLMAYEELFPDVESAEQMLLRAETMSLRKAHMALTNRAFERTPAAKLGNRPLTQTELEPYHQWLNSQDKQVHDRSALLMLGLR